MTCQPETAFDRLCMQFAKYLNCSSKDTLEFASGFSVAVRSTRSLKCELDLITKYPQLHTYNPQQLDPEPWTQTLNLLNLGLGWLPGMLRKTRCICVSVVSTATPVHTMVWCAPEPYSNHEGPYSTVSEEHNACQNTLRLCSKEAIARDEQH